MAASRGTTEERRGEGLISNAVEQEVTRGYVLAESCLCFAVKLEDFHGSGTVNVAASQKPLWKIRAGWFSFPRTGFSVGDEGIPVHASRFTVWMRTFQIRGRSSWFGSLPGILSQVPVRC